MSRVSKLSEWLTSGGQQGWTPVVIGPPAKVDYSQVLTGAPARPSTFVGGLLATLTGYTLVFPLIMQFVLVIGYVARGRPGEFTDFVTAASQFRYLEGLLASHLGLAAFIPMVLLLVRYLHQRPPAFASSVQPGIRWRFLAVCVVASTVTINLVYWISRGFAPLTGEPQANAWLWLLVLLLTAPLQAAGEEYLFRGYLTQVLGSVIRSRWAAVVASALCFALVHGAQNPALFISRFGFGLLAGGVVVLTGGLEAGIAAHTVNNLFAFGYAVAAGGVSAARTTTEVSWGVTAWSLGGYALTFAVAWLIGRRMNVATLTPDRV